MVSVNFSGVGKNLSYVYLTHTYRYDNIKIEFFSFLILKKNYYTEDSEE